MKQPLEPLSTGCRAVLGNLLVAIGKDSPNHKTNPRAKDPLKVLNTKMLSLTEKIP